MAQANVSLTYDQETRFSKAGTCTQAANLKALPPSRARYRITFPILVPNISRDVNVCLVLPEYLPAASSGDTASSDNCSLSHAISRLSNSHICAPVGPPKPKASITGSHAGCHNAPQSPRHQSSAPSGSSGGMTSYPYAIIPMI